MVEERHLSIYTRYTTGVTNRIHLCTPYTVTYLTIRLHHLQPYAAVPFAVNHQSRNEAQKSCYTRRTGVISRALIGRSCLT